MLDACFHILDSSHPFVIVALLVVVAVLIVVAVLVVIAVLVVVAPAVAAPVTCVA